MGLFGKNKIAIFLFVGVHIMVASLFFVEHVSAASVSWDGGGGNSDWCNINNWSNDALPTDADDLTINTAVTVVFTTCNPGDIDFNSLTIGGSAAATVDINQDFGTAGDITIANLGVLEQNTTSQISISGDLTVESGGTLKHADNSTTHLYSVNISAANIDIQSGGSVNVDGLGYDTGGENGAGSGPGGGGAGSNGGGGGGGASHAGNGGSGSVGAGGVAYCDISNPSTMGSGGSGGASGAGVSDGGGYISLVASNTLTVDGTITADGEVGNTYRGGGAGGGIKLVASTIAGTPTSITATGGTATTNAGGGGGGCVLVEYSATATFSSNSVSTLNGTGSTQSGGAGLYLLKKNDQNGILYVQGSSAVAATPQNSTSETYELISILGATSNYVVDTDETLTLTPLSGDDVFSNTGILDVDGVFNLSSSNINEVTIYLSGTYNNASTLTLASGSTLYLQSGVVLSTPITTITNAGNLFIHKDADIADVSLADVTLQSGGTLTQYNFTTATPLTLETVTIQSGGKINHADNTTAQTHIVNIVAGTFTIDSGGSIDVNGLGYAAGGVNGAGSGPGGGGAGSNGGGGGGGASHAGNGGSGSVGAGGVAYCDISNPSTMGSGGSGGAAGAGNSDGGGFVMLDVVGTLTVNGTITANATVRSSGNRTYRGGGAGGGINIDAAVVAGTPVLLSATGETATTAAGGGGGGCITIDYGASNSIGSATVSGGSGGVGSGASGSFTITQSNTQPTVSFDTTPSQINSTTVSTTITISDADLNETSLTIEYSQDGNPYTAATIGAVSVSEGSVTTSSGSIAGIDTDVDGEVTIVFEWLVGIDEPNLEEGNVYLRITPNDGTEDGGTNTSTVFAVDTSAPSAPSALDIFLATSSSVVLSLPDTPSYDTNFTEYLVYYSTTTPVLESDTSVSSSTDANLGAMDFNSATELESLGGLIPNTTYYFNIFAYDIFGQSTEALSEATTTTLAEMPVGLTFGSITTSSVTFVWNYGNNPTGTVYEVYNITDSVSVGTTTDDNMVLSGLTPGTYYEMYVRAQNSAGVYTDYADLVYAITSPVSIDVPAVAISTPTSLDVVFDDFENGLETTYALYINTDDLYIDADGQVTSTPVYRSLLDWSGGISVLDLNPNQAYTFVVLLDAGGAAASSPTSTVVYTLANVPEQFAWAGGTNTTTIVEFQSDGNSVDTTYAI